MSISTEEKDRYDQATMENVIELFATENLSETK